MALSITLVLCQVLSLPFTCGLKTCLKPLYQGTYSQQVQKQTCVSSHCIENERAFRKHACVLPVLEFLAIGVDYDPLQSSAIHLGSVVQNLAGLTGLRAGSATSPTSPGGDDHISLAAYLFLGSCGFLPKLSLP